MNRTVLALSLVLPVVLGVALPMLPEGSDSRTIALLEPQSPFVAFNIWVKAGSQNDPKGKEGLAALTAGILADGSTKRDSYEAILAKLYPMAAGYASSVDKEMTVFTGRIHRDNLPGYYALFKNAILYPAFREDDFKRIKLQTLNYLRQSRRFSNDEELSKELLFREIYRGTPYEHPVSGYVSSVESITLNDVRDFYLKHYTRGNVIVGIGGGYSKDYPARVRKDFDALPEGRPEPVPPPAVKPLNGIKVLLVEKDTQASPISFGYPISLLRSNAEFFPMMLANSWMGEHRNSVSNLYQVIRERRGMNYGDYSYIEAYPKGYASQVPPANVSRRSQIFEVWIRPIAATASGNLHDRTLFALRAAMREMSLLAQRGLTAEQVETQRNFLKNYIVNFGSTGARRLAYRIDDRFYGIPEPGFLESARKSLGSMTPERVNDAIQKYIQARNLQIVIITKDAQALKAKLLSGAATPINYAGAQPPSILEEDKIIASYPVPIQEVSILPIDHVFE